MGGKEDYLKIVRRIHRTKGLYGKIPQDYPYKGFDKEAVLKRDKYTCQWCGYKPTREEALEHKMDLSFFKPGVKICWERHKLVLIERICEYYCRKDTPDSYRWCHDISEREFKAFAYPKFNAHHLDENKLNNELSNLITLCCKCHRSYHGKRRKGLSIEQAQKLVKKSK